MQKQQLPFWLAHSSLILLIICLIFSLAKFENYNSYILLISHLVIVLGFLIHFSNTEEKNWFNYLGFIALIPIIGYFFSMLGYNTFLTKFSGASRIFLIVSILSGSKINTGSKTKMDAIDKYEFGKEDSGDLELTSEKKMPVRELFLIVSLAIAGLGYIFKIAHYPYASQLTIVGFVGLAISAFIYVLSMMKK